MKDALVKQTIVGQPQQHERQFSSLLNGNTIPPPCIKLLKCLPAGRTMSNRIENNFKEQIECISLKGGDVHGDC